MAEIEERALRGRIKKARKEAGLTQRELADLIDVGQRAYQNYEDAGPNGVTPWRLLNAIGRATGTSSEWLLHGDPEEADNGQARLEAKLDDLSQKLDALRADLRASEADDLGGVPQDLPPDETDSEQDREDRGERETG